MRSGKLRARSRLGKYRIEACLAGGAYSSVFRALDSFRKQVGRGLVTILRRCLWVDRKQCFHDGVKLPRLFAAVRRPPVKLAQN